MKKKATAKKKAPSKSPKEIELDLPELTDEQEVGPGGRPLLFKTPEELQAKIDEYFASCWEEVWVEELKLQYAYLTPKKLSAFPREEIYKWRQVLDHLGNPVLRQTKPYAIAALAEYLDTSRQTLINYAARDEFFDTVMRAKIKCEAFTEEQLYSGKPASGAIFSLTNNYGYTAKLDLSTLGNKLPGALTVNALSSLSNEDLIKLAKGGAGRTS